MVAVGERKARNRDVEVENPTVATLAAELHTRQGEQPQQRRQPVVVVLRRLISGAGGLPVGSGMGHWQSLTHSLCYIVVRYTTPGHT